MNLTRKALFFCLFLFLAAAGGRAQGTNVFVTNSAAKPVPVTGTFSAGAPVGAAHVLGGQVTAGTTAATLLASRATRLSALVRNTDPTNTVYIGPAGVTTTNGMPLKPGESVAVTAVTLWQVVAAAGAPVVAVLDEYN